MKPTQEEIKHLWESFGFKYEKTGQRHIPEVFEVYQWRYPDGEHYDSLPPIDLNSLFKWAVPRAIQKMMGELTYDRRSAVKALFRWWLNNNPNGIEDPALALFWAIWKVIRK